jgi:hypothetical protein
LSEAGCTACVASAHIKRRHGTKRYGTRCWEPVAVRIERLYVLTWISAWCGVFLGFDHFSLPHLYHLVPPLRKYHVFEYLHYRACRCEYKTMKSNHSCVAPLMLSESSKGSAYSPDSVRVASPSGENSPPANTQIHTMPNVPPAMHSSCNIFIASGEPSYTNRAPSVPHCGAQRPRGIPPASNCATQNRVQEPKYSLFRSSLQHHQKAQIAEATGNSGREPTARLLRARTIDAQLPVMTQAQKSRPTSRSKRLPRSIANCTRRILSKEYNQV